MDQSVLNAKKDKDGMKKKNFVNAHQVIHGMVDPVKRLLIVSKTVENGTIL